MIGSKFDTPIPIDWEVVTVGNIGQYINGYPFKPQDWGNSGLPIIRIQNLNDPSKRYNYYSGKIDDKYLIHKGDILISWSASLGTYLWNLGDAWVNQHIFKAIPDESKINRDFFYWAMIYTIERIAKNARGSTMHHVTGKEFKQSELAVPLIRSEQRRIAFVLATVQNAIEQQNELIALTRELKASLMYKLFSEGLRGEKQKNTEIGLIPVSWNVMELGKTVEYIDYGYSAPIPKTEPENGIKIVSTADINKDGEILYWKVRLTNAPQQTIKRLTLKDGDVLFNWRNSAELIGKTGVFEQQTQSHIFASFILRIRCDEEKTHNNFLKYLLNHYRQQGIFVKLSRRAVNQANYNRNEISLLKIPFPEYEEQCEIAKNIIVVENKILLHESKKKLLEDLFRTLLHQLMTAQIRVNDIEFIEIES
jgi:type I restriction enzyme, S subunit